MTSSATGNPYNFCFPIKSYIGNDLVELIPFVPSKHTQIYLDGVKEHPELYKWLAYGPLRTTQDIDDFIANWVDSDPGLILFAIKDKTRISDVGTDTPGEVTAESFGGVIALLQGSVQNASVEIGHIVILPKCQRTHVLTNCVGLLLEYCLESPEAGGLGLRRVQWQANASNEPSVGAAKKLGFHFEGIMRWSRVLPPGKTGPAKRNDGRGEGRHTAMLSICFDDWEAGGREAMKLKMVLRKK